MTHDGSWLPAHGRVHEQKVTVPATGLTPYGLRDEDAASQTANASVAHGSLDDPGRQPRRPGLTYIEYGRQAKEHGGDIDHEPKVARGRLVRTRAAEVCGQWDEEGRCGQPIV
jgi:hypothetical protein